MTANVEPVNTNTAQRFVARSMHPWAVCNYPQAAKAWFGATHDKRRNVCRFPDGSAVTFNAAGKPVEYIGG